MKKVLFIALSVFCFLLLPDTAAAQKRIVINSEPAGADIYINGIPTSLQTPALIKPPRGKSFTVGFRKQGYEDGKQLVVKQKQFDGKKAFPTEISCRLSPSVYSRDAGIPQGAAEQRVSRDNAGETTLEQTIIRWYFDSEPRGARISWRVVSGCPAEVKNTNENYLTSTPYEETRSFNIIGLTYENSRDVQIEIKASKAGNLDLVKRFNVRQAIDQQEISGFFELVPREE